MKTDKILFIDTETGGLDPIENSLLSIGLVVWQDYRILDKIEILINDGKLNVTENALQINNINIERHKNIALIPKDAITLMDAFLSKHFSRFEKITLAGHNINFDINFLKAFLLTNGISFGERFSHRSIDTSSILYFLYLAGKLEANINSSSSAFNKFNIQISDRHTALADALATAELFSKLLKQIEGQEDRNKSRRQSKDIQGKQNISTRLSRGLTEYIYYNKFQSMVQYSKHSIKRETQKK